MSLKSNFKSYYQELISIILFAIAYVPSFMWMWDRWFSRDSYYTHGILIPFVSGYLIWQIKDELKLIKRESSPLGVAFITLGLIVYVFSSVMRVNFLGAFSMLIVLIGLILHFLGIKFLKRIAFPVFFLVFMVPLPTVTIINLSFRMKMFAAQISTWVLNNMRIPAVRFGSIIKMPTSQVIVDDVCSGLRSLVSLTALGSIFAYLMKDKIYKKGLLFLSTIPIAVITNVFRVVFLASVSEIWGAEYAKGFIHDLSGFLLFALAFMLLVAVKKILE